MPRFYSFSAENKEVGCATTLKDFLPNKKHLLTHYNELQTELHRLFFVEDTCSISIFRTKREILLALDKSFGAGEISAAELKKLKREIKNF